MSIAAPTHDVRTGTSFGNDGRGRGRRLLLRGPGRSRRLLDLVATTAFIAGGILLVWSAVVHFHLWVETGGYRSIPTIGPLFLLQSVAGVLVGVGVVAVRRVWAAVIGAGFALATVGAFLLSVSHGLFGFKDSWLAPFAKEAFAVEIAAAGVLALAGALSLVGSPPRPRARVGSTPADSAT